MSKEIVNETAISTLRVLVGAIPFVGGAINEYAIDLRGRIKQDRINKFVVEFSEYIRQFQKVELDISQIQKEEFGDFFEELLISVAKTKSEIKRDAFKNLLANQIVNNVDFEYSSIFTNLINSLHEKEILIINKFRQTDTDGYIDIRREILERRQEIISLNKQINQISDKIFDRDDLSTDAEILGLKDRIAKLKKEISVREDRLLTGFEGFDCSTYGLDYPDFIYFIQDLCSKGLLVDIGIQSGAPPFEMCDITQFAYDFLDYIKSQE